MANKIKILVVDAEPGVCRDCGDMLAAKGWEVSTAFSAKDGLARAQAELFDAVVLDLELPDLPGLELLRELRRRAPGTPVIAITREPSLATAVQALKDGALDCLVKPFSTQAMRQVAESALRSRSTVAATPAAATATAVLVVHAKPELCYACLSCLVACAYSSLELPEDAPLQPNVLFAARLAVETANGYSVPLHCRQCAEGPCLTVCPTGALQRLDRQSPIFVVASRCIGCRSCVLACPLGVLTLDVHQRQVQKCDQCQDRTRVGRPPACVEHCPTEALALVRLDEWTAAAAKTAAQAATAPLGPKDPLPG